MIYHDVSFIYLYIYICVNDTLKEEKSIVYKL